MMKLSGGFPVFASRRLRSTPYTRRVEAAGLSAYTVYNHMLLPTAFESLEADYAHLKRHVQIWDVAGERQVELCGKDAHKLAMLMSARDLSQAKIGRCYYAPITDGSGGMLNDPIALRPAEDRFWFSIADSDLLFWAKGLAQAMDLQVDIFEPDVSPLAVQGPKAEDLMARVFGEEIRSIGFFRFKLIGWREEKLLIARSGWSKQGGFEIYLHNGALGERLWDDIMAEGGDYNLRAGCPNLIERIESGLLSYGNDMTVADSALECGLEKYISLDAEHDFIGKRALLKQAEQPLKKRLRGVIIDGDPIRPLPHAAACFVGGGKDKEACGIVTSAVWSPDFAANLGFAMLSGDAAYNTPALTVRLTVQPDGETRQATICDLPFQQ